MAFSGTRRTLNNHTAVLIDRSGNLKLFSIKRFAEQDFQRGWLRTGLAAVVRMLVFCDQHRLTPNDISKSITKVVAVKQTKYTRK